MSYRFRQGELVAAAARRIVLEELDAARVELVLAAHDAEALHEVRKRLKRVRALIRLTRAGFPEPASESLVLRDVGRMLAAHREADALVEILRHESGSARSADVRILEDTVRLHQAARAPLRKREADLLRARRTLWGVRRRIVGASFGEIRRKDCLRRLRQAYRRARDQWWVAVSAPTDEHLHEWRKLTKILLNELRLIRTWAGRDLVRFRSSLADLDERLGQARDFAHLAGILRGVPAAEVATRYGLGLRARLEQAVDDQLSRAFAIGRRVYRYKGRAFLDKILA